MRFSVPQLPHTFLRMVFFVVLAGALLTPLASVIAQSDVNGNGFIDSWEVSVPSPIDWDRPEAFDPDSWINNPPGGSSTVNDDGSVTVRNPITGETEIIQPNPPTPTGGQADPNSVITLANQVQLEESHGLLMTIGGWIAGAGGNLFELAYTNFALQMGCYFVVGGAGCSGDGLLVDDGQVGAVVNVLWEVIRDLVNIAIIFSLVYIGFMLIVNGDDSGTKKALGGIIMAALLINFSLYLAKVVVDVSNFSTTAIYSAMNTAGGDGFGVVGRDTDGDGVRDSDGDVALDSARNGSNLASHFMTVLRITSMYDTDGDIVSELTFAVLAMFFLIFLGAIFAYGAIMLMARFIAIIVLLIFSPVMFLGLVLPSFSGISRSWRQKFFGYCLYAPAFTFMIYISLYTLIQMAPATGSAGYGAAFNGDGASAAESMPIFLFFFIGAGLLFMSTKVAGTIASGSGTFLTKTADGFARKLTVGAAAMGAGYAATAMPGAAGKLMTTGSDALERRSGRSSVLSRGLNYTGTKAKGMKVAGVSTAGSIAATKKWWKESGEAGDKRARGLRDEAAKEAKQKEAIAVLTDPTKSALHERKIADLSPSAVVAMAKDSDGKKALLSGAGYLRPEQVKALEDDKELDKADVKAILGQRSKVIKDKYTGSTATKKLSGAQGHELSVFGIEDLTKEEVAVQLTEEQIKKLPEPKFIDSDKELIKTARKNALVKVVTTGAPVGGVSAADLAKMKADDIAALPDAVFDSQKGANANVENFVNEIKLSKMATIQNKKSDDVTKNIRTILAQNPKPEVVDWLQHDRIGKSFGI